MSTEQVSNSSTPILISAFVTGLVFAIGLGISGMTDTTKVIGFLTLNTEWNPALMLVMGGAIAVHAVVYRVVTKRSSPLFTESFSIPSRKDINGQLIGGAVLFGLGWGLGGVCPGPGLVSLFGGDTEMYVFVGMMAVGMFVFQQIQQRL
jgi:uncharacterized membrane protein YedE/YeeE